MFEGLVVYINSTKIGFLRHDTTASGMAWAIWCLSHHPECQQKVIDEVDRVFGRLF
jgi:hypothetical protein